MAYDDVLVLMGDFGRSQRRIYFLLCFPAIFCAVHKMAKVFLEKEVDYRCLLPVEHLSDAEFKLPNGYDNVLFPTVSTIKTNRKEPSKCEMYDVPIFSNVTTLEEYYITAGNDTSKWNTSKCQSFIYDKSKNVRTTVTQWNLVCESSIWVSTGASVFMAGVMVGSMVFGYLSDIFGRKPIFLISLLTQLISGILVAFSPNYITFMLLRAVVGAATSGIFIISYVIALEMVGPKKRMHAGVGVNLFFTMGYFTAGIFAYFIKDWKYLEIAYVAPSLLFIVYWWFIPESSRWLLTKGRVEEAKILLHKAAKINGVEISDETMNELLYQKETNSTLTVNKPSFLDLFRYPNLRRKSLLIFFNWMINSGTYYGLSWKSASLSDNMFVTYFISAAVEIPAYLFLMCTLNRWGRKIILCGSMIITGFFLLLMPFVPEGMDWLSILFYMIAKLAITCSYGAIYIFTTEQYPTVVRNVGLGVSSTFAKLGGVFTSYIMDLDKVWLPLPGIIYGGLALLAGLVTLLLPETLNKTLPDTIEDGENFGRKTKNLSLQSLTPTKQGLDEKQNGKHV